MKRKPSRKIIRDTVRGSVPKAKLKGTRILLSDKPGDVIGGFTEWGRGKEKNKVLKIAVPAGNRASDVAIRGHETAHATVDGTPPQKKRTEQEMFCEQIIGDVLIETPMSYKLVGDTTSYKRKKLTVAFREIVGMKRCQRAIKSGEMASTARQRNHDLIHAVRCLKMLRSYGVGVTYDKDGYAMRNSLENVAARGKLDLQDIVGQSTINAIRMILNVAAKQRTRTKAVGMLLSLLENETDPENEIDKESVPGTEGDFLSPVVGGDGTEFKMEIRNLLPKSEFTAKEKRVSRIYASTGSIINPNRFVNAIASGDATGLFARRVKQKPGGTVVIDASGSMSANQRNLSKLCALIPTATVAYYSGAARGEGILSVFALNGLRYAGELPQDTLQGGNAVDLPAIEWLMRLPKPWTLVSDLQFCGGTFGSERIAHAHVERAKARGDLVVYHSLQAAFEEWGGKGNLFEV